ncbi:carboxylesterase family domain-containing protein [Ditylenchus destructor]|nr:carboxylesterase family domain-containing protein [Ditylenchus destructor]
MTTRTKFLAHSGHARITSQQRLSILTSVLILLGCLTSQILASVTSASKNEPHGRKSVTTPFGAIRGETIATPAADGDDLPAVTQYLGIPYGVQPSAQYRFNMAISAAKWTHQPKDAFKLPAVCIQQFPQLSETEALKSTSSQRFDHIHKILPHLKPQSEDCLFMNIYVPEKITRRETGPDAPKLSVLVIVHGGDFQWGGANAFNGSILAGYGQIMVVVLNYRLGIYGFLGRCESSSCTGALSPWGMVTNPQQYFMQLADELGCGDGEKQKMEQSSDRVAINVHKQISQIVRCMQDHSQQNLTAAASKLHIPSFLSLFGPIVDGQIVPNHPKVSFSPKFGMSSKAHY